MWNTILKKVIIAILATVGLCLLLSIIGYTPKGEQELNSSYMTFSGLFVLYLLFVAPMFLTVGILFSIVIDRKVKDIFKTIVSYIVGGGIFAWLYYLLIVGNQANSTINDGILLFVGLGTLSSLLFYGIQLVLQPLFIKLHFK